MVSFVFPSLPHSIVLSLLLRLRIQFNYLFISMDSLIFIIFYELNPLLAQNQPVGSSSSWLLCPFRMVPSVFEHFLALWHSTVSNSSSTCPALAPELRASLGSPSSFHWRTVFINNMWVQVQSLLPGCHGSQALSVDRTRQQRFVHTQTYPYPSPYLPICTCIKSHEPMLVSSVLIQHNKSYFTFLPSLLVISFSDSRYPQYLLLNLSPLMDINNLQNRGGKNILSSQGL